MRTFFPRVEQPQQQHQMEPRGSSGLPRQHGREREEAAAAASGREDDSSVEEAVLHGLVAHLSHTDKHTLLLHLSKNVLPCKGLKRPEAVGGKPDLALHVPIALFYSAGDFCGTSKRYVGSRVELRQGGFHSTLCTGFAGPDQPRCKPCMQLTEEGYLEQHLQHLGEDWKDIPPQLNDAHFSFMQMVQKKEHFTRKLELARLQTLTATRQVHAKDQALGQHQRILVLLSDSDGNDRLLLDALAQALKVRRSPEAVLSIVTSCYKGLYTPRPHYTERDIAVGTLLLRFGGAAAAYAAHKELRLPGTNYLRHISQLAPFQPVIYTGLPNYFKDVEHAVATNLIRSFTPILASEEHQSWVEGDWMMMADGVFTNGQMRYHSGTNAVIGGCEHVPLEVSLVLNTPADGEAIVKALLRGQNGESGSMHMCREANVYAFMPVQAPKENALLFVGGAIPSCNKRIPLEVVEQQVRAALAGFNKAMAHVVKGGRRRGKVVVVATDGDGKRRQVLTRLSNIEKAKLDVEDLLKDLMLFDLYGGELQISVDFDMRHMIKRMRCRIVFTNKGMQLSPLGPQLDKVTVQVSGVDGWVPFEAGVSCVNPYLTLSLNPPNTKHRTSSTRRASPLWPRSSTRRTSRTCPPPSTSSRAWAWQWRASGLVATCPSPRRRTCGCSLASERISSSPCSGAWMGRGRRCRCGTRWCRWRRPPSSSSSSTIRCVRPSSPPSSTMTCRTPSRASSWWWRGSSRTPRTKA